MGAYRLKHKFVIDGTPQETEEFFTFQKTAKVIANSTIGYTLKWDKVPISARSYFLASTPKEDESFIIEPIFFRR